MRTKAPRPGKRRIGAAFIALTLALSGILVVEDTAWAAHVAAVPMGTLTNFSVLAGTMITDTGGTSTFSDGVGVWPGTATTGISPGDVGSGGLHQGDGVAQQAQTDLSTAFDYAGDQTASPIAAELGGQTLPHGVYRPGETALTLTGTLTLNGGGDTSSVFIIQTAGALGTAASSQILLTNGAQECNVFWQVEGAVTLGANSVFRGNILAQGAVTVGAGVSFRGRAFTGPGAAMTLSDNTFFEPTCVGVTVAPSATPLVTTEVGGTAGFTVVLNSEPTATVTIGVSSNDTTEGTVSTSLLTFTNLNWAAAQTVTVTGVNDSVDDGDIGYTVLLAAAVGGDYAGVDPADVAASNTDNDPAVGGGGGGGVVVVPPAGLVDTSAACPDSIATSSFGDLTGLDETTIQAIDCVFQYGVSNGTTDATFSPGETVTRWQMALFLIRQVQVHGVVLPTAIDQGFNDIGGFDQETKDAINQLAQLGITQGSGGGTFSPSNPISRWEMALFLVRFVSVVGVPLPSPPASAGFTDLSSMNADTTIAIDQLVELGIAAGTSATTFEPSNSVLRWQMALFLTRVLAVDGIIPS